MRTTRLLIVVSTLLALAACAAPVVPPAPTDIPVVTPSPIPATETIAPTATVARTATRLPTATPVALFTALPASPTYIPTPPPTWTPTPITPTSTRPPPTITPTRPPSTPTSTFTPDPLGSRQDRISGTITWHSQGLNNIQVDLYTDAGVWCGRRAPTAHTQTDGAGRYVFLDVTPGTYWLGINSDRFGSDPGTDPLYSWICTEQFSKSQASKIYDSALAKTDLRVNFPPAGSTFNNPYPTFTWDAYPEAAYYTVLLDYYADSTRRLENDTRSNGLSFVPRAALGIGKYSLRVSAWDSKNVRIASGDVRFAVQ